MSTPTTHIPRAPSSPATSGFVTYTTPMIVVHDAEGRPATPELPQEFSDPEPVVQRSGSYYSTGQCAQHWQQTHSDTPTPTVIWQSSNRPAGWFDQSRYRESEEMRRNAIYAVTDELTQKMAGMSIVRPESRCCARSEV